MIVKIIAYIIKLGSKAWDVIKGVIGSAWSSFKAAWDAGVWQATQWLIEKSVYVELIFEALKAAFGDN
ncbi:hypothetical protein [Paenibacillus sp. FSL H8-0537]|uniref:hypothetical protein n=1 Tax=Paenibacillus sp. FSL H8-0537 TaxID=2921399 RepID=UPI003100BF03